MKTMPEKNEGNEKVVIGRREEMRSKKYANLKKLKILCR